MSESGVAVAQLGGLRAVTRYQWLVFLVVWAGWSLDAADFGLYSLVLRPALIDLLGGNPPLTDIGKYGGLLAMSGLFGWAIGGFVFGILARHAGAFNRALGLRGLPLHRRAGHGRRVDGRHPAAGRDIGRDAPREDRQRHDDRRRGRLLCRLLGLWPGRRLRLALCVLPRHRAGDPVGGDPPPDVRTRALRRCSGAPASGRRGPRDGHGRPPVHALRSAAIVQPRQPLQHDGRSPVRPGLAAGGLDHGDLAADDPVVDGAEERRRRQRP